MSVPDTATVPATAHGLREAHLRLDADFDALAQRARGGDWQECDQMWDWFSRDLEEHLRIEEERYFPRWVGERPEAAPTVAELRREHQAIRAQVAGLGVDIQLHEIRAERIEAFVAALRDHARREDQTLHAWLEERERAEGDGVEVPAPPAL